jgi:glycosyltransferase 2 family protein
MRVLISFLLLARAFTLIDWENIEKALPTIQLEWLLLTLLFLWLSNATSGLRWGKIMQVGGFITPLIEYVRWYFSGGLINQGLPTTFGGDSYRAISAYNHSNRNPSISPEQAPNLKLSFYNVALDRSLGFAGNSILGAIGLGLGGYIFNDWLGTTGWILCILMIIGTGLISLLLHMQFSKQIIQKTLLKLDIHNGFQPTIYAWGWPNVIFQIPVAVFIHFLTLAAYWGCLKACHVDAPIESLLIGIPAISILMILPISISGWGIRETSLVSILGLWHLDTSLVILSSLLYGLITLITFLPGLLRLLVKKNST